MRLIARAQGRGTAAGKTWPSRNSKQNLAGSMRPTVLIYAVAGDVIYRCNRAAVASASPSDRKRNDGTKSAEFHSYNSFRGTDVKPSRLQAFVSAIRMLSSKPMDEFFLRYAGRL